MLTVASALSRPRSASDLFELLNEREIAYCHWKSNELLAEGLAGETDLDLLVDRNSYAATVAALLACGFKQAMLRNGGNIPGVMHFYGLDEGTGKLIHVHLYVRIVTGESLVKSHMLPCESILLQESERIGEVRVPKVEAESAVALLRAFLKKGSLIHSLLHGRHEGRSVRDEVLFPADTDAAEAAYRSLSMCSRAIDRQLYLDCHRALAEDSSPARQWLLGLQVRRQLRGCARYTQVGRIAAYTKLVLGKLQRMIGGKRKPNKNKILESGGAVIALIGGDATGKSTLVSELTRWLGSTFAVQSFHLGKPPHTWITLPLHIMLPAARRLFPGQRHQSWQAVTKSPYSDNGDVGKYRSLIYAVRALGLAWDRSQLVRKVQRAAAAGDIVICDRYPSDVCGANDGPRLKIHTNPRGWRAKLVNAIARWEHRLYQRNLPPDIALRLHVSIETAKQRNRQRTKSSRHSDQNLEARHQPSRAWSMTGTKVALDVDTEAGLAETTLSVKKAIWEAL